MPDSQTDWRERRIADEFYVRALDGPIFFALGVLMLAATGGYALTQLGGHALALLLLAALGVARRRHRVPSEAAELARWEGRHWLLVQACSLVWSLLLMRVGQLEQGSTTTVLVAVVCTVAYGTAAASAFALRPRQALLTIALLLLPGLLLLAQWPALRAVAITLAIYGLYLLAATLRHARSWEAQLQIEAELRASRAEVEQLSRQDPLTGLANRRDFDERFPQAWALAQRQRAPLALLVLDIDHFKQLNDRHGHLAGDAALQHLALLLRQHFRRGADLLTRLGGEEFGVLLPGIEAESALQQAERLQARLREQISQFEGESLQMTVSIGIALADWARDVQPQQLHARADAACYAAKREGRDRIRIELT